MRLMVSGASGMLGHDVMRAGRRAGHELAGLAHGELDVADGEAVERTVARVRPEAIVNCAAWTDVDGAETHARQAHAVNADGAGNLARAAAAAGVPLVHVSTDYVFSGEALRDARGAPRPYVESDPTGPRSVYGQSKLAGEHQVLAASAAHTIVRSSWLFGVDGHNFVATMLRLAGEQRAGGSEGAASPPRPLRVVSDQTGCPTWTGHLAPALVGLIEREIRGVVHLAGSGQVSWHGFAREIFRQAELDCLLEAATSAQLARPAPRPAWSVMASERSDVLPMPDWRDGLAGYLATRAGMMRA
jgi:dTDP-4-dehydrorhamnose reductase